MFAPSSNGETLLENLLLVDGVALRFDGCNRACPDSFQQVKLRVYDKFFLPGGYYPNG